MDIDPIGSGAFLPRHRNARGGAGVDRGVFALRFGEHVVGEIRASGERRTLRGKRAFLPRSGPALAQKIRAGRLAQLLAQPVRRRAGTLDRLEFATTALVPRPVD